MNIVDFFMTVNDLVLIDVSYLVLRLLLLVNFLYNGEPKASYEEICCTSLLPFW